jgi:hypothetical protein
MRNKHILLKLADKLETLDRSQFDMSQLNKDALYYLTTIPEAKKAGFAFIAGDEDDPGVRRVWRKGKRELDAVIEFFGIDIHAALHLFDQYEHDVNGYQHDSPFFCDKPQEDFEMERKNKRFHRPSRTRAYEPPMWTAGRLRDYANGYTLEAA